MPPQSVFRLIKRWKRYQPRGDQTGVPLRTRGLYVLYQKKGEDYEVVYLGVAGLGRGGSGGIRSRLRSHDRKANNKNMKGWTHYSMFEVHDNVTREEIRELEAMLLAIFRHDHRISLANKQKGSHKLYLLRRKLQWT